MQSYDFIIPQDYQFQSTRVIVFPIDGTVASEQALDWAIKEMFLPQTDKIVLVHVRSFPYYSIVPILPGPAITEMNQMFLPTNPSVYEISEKMLIESKQLLFSTAKKLEARNIHVEAVSLIGDASEELERFIEHLKPDLVVLGNRGLGIISRAILGSVSEHLLHHSNVPITVVPCH